MLQAGFLHPQRSADVSVVDCAEIPARLLNSALLLLPVSRYIPMQKTVVMIVVVLTMILHLSIAGLQGIRKAAGVRESMIRGTAGDGALSGQWSAVGGPECAGGGLSPVREVVCPRADAVECPRRVPRPAERRKSSLAYHKWNILWHTGWRWPWPCRMRIQLLQASVVHRRHDPDRRNNLRNPRLLLR